MPACIGPELETPVEAEPTSTVEMEPEPESSNTGDRVRKLLREIFAGHEEFLGWTPD